jgi:7-carboxy-7-deazaguanine synthase
MSKDTVNLYSIFPSISGEAGGVPQGTPTTFVRFAECNLNCSWCDTKYAIEEGSGKRVPIPDVIQTIDRMGNQHVCITGGEPMLQKNQLARILHTLLDQDYFISVETNGSYPIWHMTPLLRMRVNWIIDYKPPSSGMNHYMLYQNFVGRTRINKYIKYVIKTEDDYAWFLRVMAENLPNPHFNLTTHLISPSLNESESYDHMGFIGKLNVDLSMFKPKPKYIISYQLHKLLKLKEE